MKGTKRNRRLKRAEKPEHKRFSRRQLLIGAAGVLGLGAVASSVIAGLVRENQLPEAISLQMYERGYAISEPDDDWILVEQTKREENLSDAEMQSRVLPLLSSYLEKNGFPPAGVINYKGAYQVQKVIFESDSKYAARVIEGSKDSIGHALGFWGNERIARPDVEYVVPRSVDDVVSKLYSVDKGHAVIYFLRSFKPVRTHEFDFQTPSIPGVHHAFLEEELQNPGYSFRGAGLDIVLNGQYRIVNKRLFPIYVKLNVLPHSLVGIPPAEVLHHQLAWQTFDNVERELNRGRAGGSRFTDIFNRHIYREELLVHAVQELWLPAYAKRLGLDGNPFANKENYPGVPELADRIRQLDKDPSAAAKKAIDFYFDNPDSLYARTGF